MFEVDLLIRMDLERHWTVTTTVLAKQLQCAMQGLPAGLVIVEKVPSEQDEVNLFLSSNREIDTTRGQQNEISENEQHTLGNSDTQDNTIRQTHILGLCCR